MADRTGRHLMTVGSIITIIGLSIVLFKVLRVPGYWVPVVIGLAIFVVGLVRWLTAKAS